MIKSYQIHSTGLKSIIQLNKLDKCVIIASCLSCRDAIRQHRLTDLIDHKCLFENHEIANLRGKKGLITRKKLYAYLDITRHDFLTIYLPNKKEFRLGEHKRLVRFIFDHLVDLNIPVIPVYYHPIGDDHMVVRVGRIIKDAMSSKLMRNYIIDLFNALQVNLDRPILFEHSIKPPAQIATPQNPLVVEAELARLPKERLVYSRDSFHVYIAPTHELPNTIKEIGRLREITFRSVGEGTGRSEDIDRFDDYYLQLFIWDNQARIIVGGYRLGLGDKIINKFGLSGMYINQLFKIKSSFTPILQSSIELGRSFIIIDYQKKRLPLFLLWRGILELLNKNSQYKYLYGPVTISKYYSHISKRIIISFIMSHYYDAAMAKMLKPRKPYKYKFKKKNIKKLLGAFKGQLSQLEMYIEDIEPDHLKLPILIKQYIKQNAKFIGFNLDPNFSDALDGFVLLKLDDFPTATMDLLANSKQGL